jgi:hypothetical protein
VFREDGSPKLCSGLVIVCKSDESVADGYLFFLDDFVIGGKTFEEHMEIMAELLRRQSRYVRDQVSWVATASSRPIEGETDPLVSTTRDEEVH